jgi:hypothetical protein
LEIDIDKEKKERFEEIKEEKEQLPSSNSEGYLSD